MQIIIKSKNIELTAPLEQVINKRMAGLEKFARELHKDSTNSEVSEVIVEIEKTKHHRKGDVFAAEGILLMPGKKIVARSHGEDLMKLITEVRDQLDREVKGYKGKMKSYRRDSRKAKREIL